MLLAAAIVGVVGGLLGAYLLVKKYDSYGVMASGAGGEPDPVSLTLPNKTSVLKPHHTAGGGLMIALFANGFILHHLYDQVPSASDEAYVPYLVDTAFMLLGGIITYYIMQDTASATFVRRLIILSTAFSGSYFLGWAVMRLLHQTFDVNDGEGFSPLEQFTGSGCTGSTCNLAMIACILLGLVGIYFQFYHTARDPWADAEVKVGPTVKARVVMTESVSLDGEEEAGQNSTSGRWLPSWNRA